MKTPKMMAVVLCLAVASIISACGTRATETTPSSSIETRTMTRPSDGMQMVFVEGASFELSERGRGGAGSHNVRLDSYWIDQTEVTNEQYAGCVEDGNCQAPTTCAWGEPTYGNAAYQDHPVICVTRAMASNYCARAGGRLPTEAEWDYAARGPERTIYPWGENADPARLNFCDASCSHTDARYADYDDGYAQTSPAGSFQDGASWCGALDMAGNVWEWVSDGYAPYSRTDEVNPTGSASASEGIIRGGSWYDDLEFSRSDHRHPYDPRDYNFLIGFRCVVEPDQVAQLPTSRSTIAATAPEPVTAVGQLIQAIEELGAADEFSGAVLIAQDGQPIYQAAFGLASRSPDVPNQLDTLFNLGSMNKMFTAVAVLQLVEDGQLSLEGTIADYWPDYPNQEVAANVTIEQLLTHTAGMGDVFQGEFFTTPADQLRTLEGYLPLFVYNPLQFEPGTQFGYSNEGYLVLGIIIEKVTGLTYWDYVEENIYQPSGMSHTSAIDLGTEVPNRAIGYTTVDAEGNQTGELTDHTPLMPIKGTSAGGGYSTVGDLLNFSNALLGNHLLSPALTELLMDGQVEVREGIQYAYGFFDKQIAGQRIVGHTGGAPGVCDFMEMFLDSGYTVIVLSNSDQECSPIMEFLWEHPF
ncbi:MAG: serine hydrolase [Anaerolineales bacterium]|jgi:CubicO group peptidase (beta-lactamase class C family)/formylglycine-generating enzyme required for sulfatase activity